VLVLLLRVGGQPVPSLAGPTQVTLAADAGAFRAIDALYESTITQFKEIHAKIDAMSEKVGALELKQGATTEFQASIASLVTSQATSLSDTLTLTSIVEKAMTKCAGVL
jgi:DNA-binding transcriptional regulator YbjK